MLVLSQIQNHVCHVRHGNPFMFEGADQHLGMLVPPASPHPLEAGTVAVGHNFNVIGNYTTEVHNVPGTIGKETNVAAYIQGNVTGGGTLGANNNGNTYIAGTNVNPLHLNGGLNYSEVEHFQFLKQALYSRAQSQFLSTLTGTAINTSSANQWSLDASSASTYTVGTDKLGVFNVAASALNDAAIIAINNVASNETVLINVTGSLSGVTWNADAQNFGAKSNLLWNYNGSDSFTIGRQFDGSLLAPNATVTQSSSGKVDGTLIAGNWINQGSENHSYTFNGQLPSLSAVPEAGSVWGFSAMLGLAGISVSRRRKR